MEEDVEMKGKEEGVEMKGNDVEMKGKEKAYILHAYQVSGKQPKLVSEDGRKLLKGFSSAQQRFYLFLNGLKIGEASFGMKQFVPNYEGNFQLQSIPEIEIHEDTQDPSTKQWMKHLILRYKERNTLNKFIILENLTFHLQKPNVFDIKVGGRNQEGKLHKITKSVATYFIKLNGSRIYFSTKEKEVLFLSKYQLQTVTEKQQIKLNLALFFYDGQQINKELLKMMVQKMKEISLCFKNLTSWSFISSSIFMYYDSLNPKLYDVKFIDFGRCNQLHQEYFDKETSHGIQNITNFLTEILTSDIFDQTFLQKIYYLKQHYANNTLTIVPDRKKQYV